MVRRRAPFVSTAVAFAFLFAIIGGTTPVLAEDYSSPHFTVRAPVLGAGGSESTSTSFSVISNLGDLAAGISSGLTFEQIAGFASFYVVPVTGKETHATSSVSHSSASNHSFDTNKAHNSSKLTFPANFYDEPVDLEVDSHSKDSFGAVKPAPSGKNFVGKAYDFNLFDADGAPVTSVNKAINIVLEYADDDVTGIDESTLTPYRWGSGDSSWQLITGGTVDTVNNKITFSTTLFSSFTIFGSPVAEEPAPPAPAPAPSSPGGGGGMAILTGASFSGRAYPLSKITLLKDGQIVASTVAGPDANFSISLTNLGSGSHNFAVYGEDGAGRRSSLLTFPVTVSYGALTDIGGIFIAPTIAVDKSEVRKGDNIAIFGQTAAKAEVTLEVNSDEPIFAKTASDKNGVYLYNLDTSVLDLGRHLAKSKSALGNSLSPYGQAVGFKVGTENVSAASPTSFNSKADFNGDSRVNLVDFSILAYWYKRPLAAGVAAKVDLNGDGKIDIKDFSILAYWWTG
jgi:hypothetical protein